MVLPFVAHPQHWLTVSIGRANFNLAALVNTTGERIGVELYLSGADAKKHFKRLEAEKADIEKEIGQTLDWRELPDKEVSRLIYGFKKPKDREAYSFPEVRRHPA